MDWIIVARYSECKKEETSKFRSEPSTLFDWRSHWFLSMVQNIYWS